MLRLNAYEAGPEADLDLRLMGRDVSFFNQPDLVGGTSRISEFKAGCDES